MKDMKYMKNMMNTKNTKHTKYSTLFGKTTRDVSKDIVLDSHKLLFQGGFIRQSVAGRYYFLPLGLRVRNKIQNIIREEMNNTGAQEIISPVLQQLSLWQETKRDEAVNFELMQIEDRRGEKFALGGTAEEMVVDLVRRMQISYRDLPFNLYQFSTKFRDEARSYGGLLRLREFLMKDGYSFDKSQEAFEISYKKMWDAYVNVYSRCGINTHAIEGSGGVMGDYKAHQFEVEHIDGEDKYFISEDEVYAAHEDIAQFERDLKNIDEQMKDMEIVEVERGNSVQEGVRVHKNEACLHIKNVIYKVSLHKYSKFFREDKEYLFVHAVIRGDLGVNEDKLQKYLDATKIDPASEQDLIKLGYVAGFISPCKVFADILVGDLSLNTFRNGVTGGDEKNKDRINVNLGRDYIIENLEDIALAYEEAKSINNHGKLSLKRGTEVGNIFELKYKYTKAMNANFMDDDGKSKPYYMGCYGLGLERTLQMIVEKNHDENGIIWPQSVSPYDIHLITIGEDEQVILKAQEIIQEFESRGLDVLWDDREKISVGIKFNDADLIGCPIRIVISQKTLSQGSVEIKRRNEDNSSMLNFNELEKI